MIPHLWDDWTEINGYAPTGQRAHSPGQSVAAPRESNIANSRALKGQKHKKYMECKKCKYLIINAFALLGRMCESYYPRGAASLCPGLCARSPFGRVLV